VGRFARRFPGFTLRPSRVFWAFVAAVPVLSLAALNTGNNALYLLLSLALGAFVSSGALSRHTLSHISARLELPGDIFAGSPVRLRATVSNSSRWLPAAGVVCRLVGATEGALVPTVAPGGERVVELITVFSRRGLRALPAVRVEVRLPLGFFVKSLQSFQSGEVLVYPRRFPGAAARLAPLATDATVLVSRGARRGGDVELLREFRPGDDVRDVHWKQTARQQRPIVMERREHHLPARYVVLDRQLARRDDALLLERFEDLVSEVATTLLDRLRRGEVVGLILGSQVRAPAGGVQQARALLQQLALVEPVGVGEDPLPKAVGQGPVYRLVEAS
jgi:uncharacterized protein (DUF58 family)